MAELFVWTLGFAGSYLLYALTSGDALLRAAVAVTAFVVWNSATRYSDLRDAANRLDGQVDELQAELHSLREALAESSSRVEELESVLRDVAGAKGPGEEAVHIPSLALGATQ